MSHLQASFGMELLLWVASVASRPENAKRILVGHGSISTAAGGAGNVNSKGDGKDDDDDEAFMFGLAKYMLVTRSMANVRPTTLIIQIQAALDNAAISGVDECWCARACACGFYSWTVQKKKTQHLTLYISLLRRLLHLLYLPRAGSSQTMARTASLAGFSTNQLRRTKAMVLGAANQLSWLNRSLRQVFLSFVFFFERRKRRREKKYTNRAGI